MYVVQIGYPTGLNALKIIVYICLPFNFKQPKRRLGMSSPMLPLCTEATTEEKTNTCTYRHRPTYIDLLQHEAN